MERRFIASGTVVIMAATALLTLGSAHASQKTAAAHVYEPVLDPANFVSVIDNPYYPLPVGRTLIYTGIKDGLTQRETVNVTSDTRVIEGITATALSDISKHKGTLLEKTTDWYAQDKQGNVWYLGEDTKAYSPNGHVDTSGSWVAGINDGEPGIIMEANPQVPDAYRQELLAGEAADTAWIVDRGGSITVPYGTVHQVLTSLEATQVEPGSYDQKIYAPGLGIVREQALTDVETSRLVKVIN
ncbi:MAG: hypothetical protein QOE25_91 [Actinomycetota bacterium]|nr:hypothetical protein [Actinomycetota bacterium]